jgi:cell wall-associated NlpC family hydrolase
MRPAILFGLLTGLAAAPAAATFDGASDRRAAPLVHALYAVGTLYKYGGDSPETGFDCSGLVTHVFKKAWGVALPRRAREQKQVGRAVKLKELEAGDLVFYNTRNKPYSHVGIYLGDGRFVHAPRQGARVRIESVQNPYWRARFNGARRLDPPAT